MVNVSLWTIVLVAVITALAVGSLCYLVFRRRERRTSPVPAAGSAGKQFLVRYQDARRDPRRPR